VAKPIIMIVDGDADALSTLEHTVHRRYAADYQILSASSPAAGLALLERLNTPATLRDSSGACLAGHEAA
jgi:hypothetical protein